MDRPDFSEGGLIREKQIREIIPIAHSTLWEWVRDGTFPAPAKLSSNVTVWKRAEVEAWLNTKFQKAS